MEQRLSETFEGGNGDCYQETRCCRILCFRFPFFTGLPSKLGPTMTFSKLFEAWVTLGVTILEVVNACLKAIYLFCLFLHSERTD